MKLAFGDVVDMGYGEFLATAAYAEVLVNGAMTSVNGVAVSLKIVDRGIPGCAIVRVTPRPQVAALELAA